MCHFVFPTQSGLEKRGRDRGREREREEEEGEREAERERKGALQKATKKRLGDPDIPINDYFCISEGFSEQSRHSRQDQTWESVCVCVCARVCVCVCVFKEHVCLLRWPPEHLSCEIGHFNYCSRWVL